MVFSSFLLETAIYFIIRGKGNEILQVLCRGNFEAFRLRFSSIHCVKITSKVVIDEKFFSAKGKISYSDHHIPLCLLLWLLSPGVISLGNTREPLFIVNRSGNVASHCDSPIWIDKSPDLVDGIINKVQLGGDTDFSLTGHLDRWDQRCTFVFGMDAKKNLVAIADGFEQCRWEPFERKKQEVKTQQRKQTENFKDQVVEKLNFQKLQTESEYVSEYKSKDQ